MAILNKHILPGLAALLCIVLLGSSCGDKGLAAGKVSFSRDTVLFDTSFVQIGSMSKVIRVFNPGNRDIRLKSVYLEKASASRFRINVDGVPGPKVDNVEILAGDSIYVFIESTVDPSGGSGSLFEEDRIVFDYDKGPGYVYLAAPGQDAIYYYPNDTLLDNYGRKYPVRILQGNHIWSEGKPIVIVGTLVVDAGATLTMQPGTHVHMFNGAILWVYKGGTLKLLGERNRRIIVEGTRLGTQYANLAGQWDRIWINEGSTGHVIRHAIIKNGRMGIQAGGLDISDGSSPRSLLIEHTSVYNMTVTGILAINYNINADNVFVNQFSQYGMALLLGGTYNLRHVTVAGYQSGTRPQPGLFFANYYQAPDGLYVNAMNFKAENSIFYGTNPTEVSYDSDNGAALNFLFRNCLIKIDEKIDTDIPSFVNIVKNKDPQFYAPYYYDPSLKGDSPARDSADVNITGSSPSLLFDYHGINRLTDGRSDMGCAEYKGD